MMDKKKTKNPLRKRILRELMGDWKKYLVVSLFLILTIGFVSGMYVANGSMEQAAAEGITKYKREDGHFELSGSADEALLTDIKKEGENEDVPVFLFEQFYRNETEDHDQDGNADGTVRVYTKNDEVNLACLLDGRFPETADEIAIDRMHADNAGLKTGQYITVGGEEYQIVGLIAYVNYATLHEKSTDMMFDAIQFDVAMVTEEGFERLGSAIHYAYAWQYEAAPETEEKEKTASDDFMKALVGQVLQAGLEVTDFVPAYSNPAIQFATDDMGSDKAMGGVLLDILVVIIAFIFAVTISNTIAKEASTIGTLRALGYTKGELIRHFLAMPVIVTCISAVIGNVLGYTLFKNVVVSMYYNSYSLPTYQTIWNTEAFWKTTLVPVLLMLLVNLLVITRMMQNTPLQFLRHELKKRKRKKAMRLPRWSFFARFRLRIIFQNIPNYLILFVGIFFVMVLLAMAVGMPSTLDYYKENTEEMMFADYQYVLKRTQDELGNPIETSEEAAEKFAMCALQKKEKAITEEISVYGILPESRYVELSDLAKLQENEVYISHSFSEKYDLRIGDSVVLDEKYGDQTYEFVVAGLYDRCQSIAVFMPIEQYWSVFELEEGSYTGYFSNTELSDLKEKNIATVITEREITKMCDQLDHSMGSYMTYFQILCILLSAVLIYLLTKLIIEKNETAISMTKILGYENGEIARLYLFSTTLVVLGSEVLCVWLGTIVMAAAWKIILFSYSGWYAFVMEPAGYVKMFAFVGIGYLIVLFFDFKRIRRIPMEQALKNME